MTLEKFDIHTLLVHAGERQPARPGQPVSTPVYTTTTFTYENMSDFDLAFSGEGDGYLYARFGNPTNAALESAMAILERGACACVFASGMAALHAALIACELRPGATVIASQDLYGATLRLLYDIFDSFGVRTVMADFNDIEALKRIAGDTQPRALLTETISNPLLKVCDIKASANVAHAVGARLIVDNTFASPYLCQPLTLGADFSVHSATKYLGGHCDATGGVVVARDEMDVPSLMGTMKLVGGVLGVWDAHEILRGIKTLGLRMERQCANARRIAEHFATHERIKRVYYPGSMEVLNETSAPNATLRAGYGGALVTIALAEDTRDAAFRFMDNLRLCVRSTSLGDVFTGVLHPATASHRDLSPAQRARLGIGDGAVRISVGIEDVNDIIADIEQALNSGERL